MSKIIAPLKTLFIVLIILQAIHCHGQKKPRNIRQELTWLRNSLSQNHVNPRSINDEFSSDLFDKLLDDMDPDRVFFTQADIAWMESFRNLLDDEINGKDTGFLNRLRERYQSGLKRSEKLIHTILESGLDWKKKEFFHPDGEWAKDEEDLVNRHRQWLKYEVLERLVEIMERDSLPPRDFFKQNISEAIAYVETSSVRPLTRMLKDQDAYQNDVANTFLQSVASVFDPHSTFFSTHDFDDFVASLSTEDYYFGFTLGEDGRGNVIISGLAPGGAAWKSGALHVSDVLVAIRWAHEERIDLRGMNIDDVNEMLARNDAETLEMTLRGVDGNEKKVTLRKEKLQSEENVVQSFILEGDKKVGYVYLPDFYTRWDDEREGGRCANDVAKEIIKLKKENIEGLILDLRFNGGGSLYEARAMAGIFIDEGALALVSTREKKGSSLKDVNRGTVYDGPLVIMVNGGSASASEVLAASVQDYNRGLIVGGQTYGKATGQNIFPLEGLPAGATTKKGLSGTGYVKVTTQRLYRVTGKSAQGRGVTPDVVIPDIFSALDVRESEYSFSLKPDSILMNTYYKPLPPMNRKELRARSQERISKNPAFQELQKTIAWLEAAAKKDLEPQPLEWDKFLTAAMETRKYKEAISGTANNGDKIFEISNPAAKEQRLAVDDYGREVNERWLKLLMSDIHLQETYQVLRDHIVLK